MSLLPDIDENGKLKLDKTPSLYTPPTTAKPVSFEADGMQRDKTHIKDVPTEEAVCITCGQHMII